MADLVVFHLGGLRYGLTSTAVREVVRAVAVLPLPKAPPIVEGIIDYRGAVVPVLDIRARFGLPGTPLDPHQHFIVATAAERTVALRVDRVAQIVAIDANGVESIESSTPYVAGVIRLPDGLVLIHDLGTFLDSDESVALDAAIAEAGR